MSISEKLMKVAENIPKVYKAGQASMVDESKIIEGTANGQGSVSVNDVSEIPHEVGIKLTGEPVFTGGGLLEGGYFEDTDFGFIRSSVFTVPETGIYTLALNTEVDVYFDDGVYCAFPEWKAETSPNFFKMVNSKTGRIYLYEGQELRLFFDYTTGLKVTNILSATLQPGEYAVLPEQNSFNGIQVKVSGDNEETIYTAGADGNIVVKSMSPNMTISTEDANIGISATYRKSFGMHTERQQFWEEFQVGGTRTNYYNFSYRGEFTDETYNPLYPLTVKNGYQMFSGENRVTDTKVPIILKGTADYSFSGSKLKRIHSIDFTDISKITSFFYLSYDIEECNVVGTIKKNGINLVYSKKLSHASLMSFVNALEDKTADTSGTAWKISFGPTNLEKLSEEEKNIMTQKGWQFS